MNKNNETGSTCLMQTAKALIHDAVSSAPSAPAAGNKNTADAEDTDERSL